MLYVSLGDGGAADDQGAGHVPGGNGQDPTNILGSILRIDPDGDNSANGVSAEGTAVMPDAGNACGWTDIEDAVTAIQNGNAYVNVHTLAHPAGEIRGQLH